MSNIVKSADQLIGKTPLLELENYAKAYNVPATILGKLEYLNPTGSVKDRAAVYMIDDAEEKGRLKPGGTIIEPTSGNTGIGIASVGAARGYRVIIVMPETMTKERRDMISAYGAEIVLTDGKSGMSGAVAKAKAMVDEIEGSIILSQFENPANSKAHFETTGPEIWDDTDGKVDIFVSGVGTGGTVSGVGEFLKSKNPDVKIIAVEPASSPVLSEGKSGPHKIQGIGAGFVPDVLNTGIYDEIITVTNEDSYDTARAIAKTQGVLVGISSGAALWAAAELAKRPENKGKTIVALLPDSGDRYLSVLNA
jgi:cysteine synthase A